MGFAAPSGANSAPATSATNSAAGVVYPPQTASSTARPMASKRKDSALKAPPRRVRKAGPDSGPSAPDQPSLTDKPVASANPTTITATAAATTSKPAPAKISTAPPMSSTHTASRVAARTAPRGTTATVPTASSRAKRATDSEQTGPAKRQRTVPRPASTTTFTIKPSTTTKRSTGSARAAADKPVTTSVKPKAAAQPAERPPSSASSATAPTASSLRRAGVVPSKKPAAPPVQSKTTRPLTIAPTTTTTTTRQTRSTIQRKPRVPTAVECRQTTEPTKTKISSQTVVVPVQKRARISSSNPDRPTTVVEEPAEEPCDRESPNMRLSNISTLEPIPEDMDVDVDITVDSNKDTKEVENESMTVDSPFVTTTPLRCRKSSWPQSPSRDAEVATSKSIPSTVSAPNLGQPQSPSFLSSSSTSNSLKRSLALAFPSKIPVLSPKTTPKRSPQVASRTASWSSGSVSRDLMSGNHSSALSTPHTTSIMQTDKSSPAKSHTGKSPGSLTIEIPSFGSVRSNRLTTSPQVSPRTPTRRNVTKLARPSCPIAGAYSRGCDGGSKTDLRSSRSMNNLSGGPALEPTRTDPLGLQSTRFSFPSSRPAKPFVFRDTPDSKAPKVSSLGSPARTLKRSPSRPGCIPQCRSTNSLLEYNGGSSPAKSLRCPSASPQKLRSMNDLHSSPTKSSARSVGRSRLRELGCDDEPMVGRGGFRKNDPFRSPYALAPPPMFDTSIETISIEDATGEVTPEAAIAMEDFINSPLTDDDPTYEEVFLSKPRQPLATARSGNIPHLSPRKAVAAKYDVSPVKSSLKRPQRFTMSPKKSVGWEKPAVVFSSTLSPVRAHQPQSYSTVLRGAVVFLDVYDNGGQNCGELFRPLLEELGAECVPSWSSRTQEVTHVLFKDGELRTLTKVVASNGAVKCVNIGWPLDCERAMKWLDEGPYMLDLTRIAREGGISPDSAMTKPRRAGSSGDRSPTKVDLGSADDSSMASPGSGSVIGPSEHRSHDVVTQFDRLSIVVDEDEDDEPETPRYIRSPHSLEQKTCPPKQHYRRPFGGSSPSSSPTPSPTMAAVGRGGGHGDVGGLHPKRHSFSLDFRPRVPSPLRRHGG